MPLTAAEEILYLIKRIRIDARVPSIDAELSGREVTLRFRSSRSLLVIHLRKAVEEVFPEIVDKAWERTSTRSVTIPLELLTSDRLERFCPPVDDIAPLLALAMGCSMSRMNTAEHRAVRETLSNSAYHVTTFPIFRYLLSLAIQQYQQREHLEERQASYVFACELIQRGVLPLDPKHNALIARDARLRSVFDNRSQEVDKLLMRKGVPASISSIILGEHEESLLPSIPFRPTSMPTTSDSSQPQQGKQSSDQIRDPFAPAPKPSIPWPLLNGLLCVAVFFLCAAFQLTLITALLLCIGTSIAVYGLSKLIDNRMNEDDLCIELQPPVSSAPISSAAIETTAHHLEEKAVLCTDASQQITRNERLHRLADRLSKEKLAEAMERKIERLYRTDEAVRGRVGMSRDAKEFTVILIGVPGAEKFHHALRRTLKIWFGGGNGKMEVYRYLKRRVDYEDWVISVESLPVESVLAFSWEFCRCLHPDDKAQRNLLWYRTVSLSSGIIELEGRPLEAWEVGADAAEQLSLASKGQDEEVGLPLLAVR